MSCHDLSEDAEALRRKCGCLRTSDALKEALAGFPSPPPPSPVLDDVVPADTKYACISVYCTQEKPHLIRGTDAVKPLIEPTNEKKENACGLLAEVFRLLQLSTAATALLVYYLVYFYVQLLYMTFRSFVYFHNVDGPMKLTIGVITATSLLVAFNLLLKIERFFCYH